MKNSGNQIKAKMIKMFPKTDGEKLAGLEKFLKAKYPDWTIKVEPYMLFTKGEDEYLSTFDYLSREQVENHIVHHPDVYIIRGGKPILILELDGSWHDKHVEATNERNRRYALNKVECIVVNETDLKFELGLSLSATLTQDQINEAFNEKITL